MNCHVTSAIYDSLLGAEEANFRASLVGQVGYVESSVEVKIRLLAPVRRTPLRCGSQDLDRMCPTEVHELLLNSGLFG